jgi:hypothetical protein
MNRGPTPVARGCQLHLHPAPLESRITRPRLRSFVRSLDFGDQRPQQSPKQLSSNGHTSDPMRPSSESRHDSNARPLTTDH